MRKPTQEVIRILEWIIRRKALLLLFSLAFITGVILRLSPYLINDPVFEVGFDTGIYEHVVEIFNSADNWRGGYPAYPPVSPKDEGFMEILEPGFFVQMGLVSKLSFADVHFLFRYYLPVLTCALTFVLAFVVGRKITGSDLGGISAGLLFAVSNIQYEAVNESYYKQIFGMFSLLVALYAIDRYVKDSDTRYLIPLGLLGGSIYAYNRPAAFTFFLFVFVVIVYFLVRRNSQKLLRMAKAALASFVFTLPVLIPNFGAELTNLKTVMDVSFTRVGMIGSEAGRYYFGGAIPGVLQGFNHVLLGYLITFAPIVIMAVGGALFMRKSRVSSFLVPFALLLAVYIGLWLYFSNRFIYELDLIVVILSACGIFAFARRSALSRKPILWQRVSALLIAALVIGSIALGLVYQSGKTPHITHNVEGVEWLEENVDKELGVIFAPDYISTTLLQRGFRMAMWDDSIAENGSSMITAESFILNAPDNSSFLVDFFERYPDYSSLYIYVIWGSAELERPLRLSGEFIPANDYEESLWFELSYDGYAEILRVYQFVGI